MSTRVLFAGGGTAGHVFPALATARALVEMADVEPVFAGTSDRLEGRLVPAAGLRLHHVEALPLPRRPSMALMRVPKGVRAAVRRCEEIIRSEDAKAVVTFGGYVSFPVSWAAARLGLPLVIHEQNAVPGVANRFAARWADRVAVTFPGSADRFPDATRVTVTGNPVRDAIRALDADAIRLEAREAFGLKPDRFTLLVFGGSQGARSLNRAIVGAHGRWSDPGGLQILHAAGSALHREAAAAWETARAGGSGPLVRCVDFIDDMGAAYAAADAVVCRSGATSIAELTVLGLPALLVPYPHATRDHQLHNALALAQVGAARVIEDAKLTAQELVATIEPWRADEGARAEVARAARMFARPHAAEALARLVCAQLGGGAPVVTTGPARQIVAEDA